MLSVCVRTGHTYVDVNGSNVMWCLPYVPVNGSNMFGNTCSGCFNHFDTEYIDLVIYTPHTYDWHCDRTEQCLPFEYFCFIFFFSFSFCRFICFIGIFALFSLLFDVTSFERQNVKYKRQIAAHKAGQDTRKHINHFLFSG